MRKKIGIICGIIAAVLLILGLLLFFLFRNNAEKVDPQNSATAEDVIIRENVRIISAETGIQPTMVTEDRLVFSDDPEYDVGDIVVAGIIESAPEGFIRRIVGITKEDESYVYETEYAVLADVFEKAHFVRRFLLTQDGVYDMDDPDHTNLAVELTNISFVQPQTYTAQTLAQPRNGNNANGIILLSDSDDEYLFEYEFEFELDEDVSVSGDVAGGAWLEVAFDSDGSEVEFAIKAHVLSKGEVLFGCSESLFDESSDDDGEYSKTLLEKPLPSFEFTVGLVPIVITNDLAVTIDASMQVEGSIGTTVAIEAERVVGFEYNSKTGKITEVNESTYLGDGLSWKVTAGAEGTAEAGVNVHLISKAYGSTGLDMSAGIFGYAKGEVSVGLDPEKNSFYYGALSLGVAPRLQGRLVVTVPVIDYKLVSAPLFVVDLPAFWEQKWESGKPENVTTQQAYAAYLELLEAHQTEIGNYDWQHGIQSEKTNRQVALCDITGDDIPELFFFESEHEHGYRAELKIYTYVNGSVHEIPYLYTGVTSYTSAVGASNRFYDDLVSAGTSYVIYKGKQEGQLVIYWHNSGDESGWYTMNEFTISADGTMNEITVLEDEEIYFSYPEEIYYDPPAHEYLLNGTEISESQYNAEHERLLNDIDSVLMYSYCCCNVDIWDRISEMESLGMSYQEMVAFLRAATS